jgi:type I restriction enzyme, S subunit
MFESSGNAQIHRCQSGRNSEDVNPLKWRPCKLGDVLEIKHGYAFLGRYFADAGSHVVLTPGNFFEEGGFKDKGDKEKWYNGPVPDDYILNAGDVVVAMTEQAEGLLGSSAVIPHDRLYLHNQRLGLVQVRDKNITDSLFLYYLFNSKPVRQQIRASASGTKIRHTAPSRITEVRVSFPPLPIQRRIAGILSAYDELIENSQRRIKILEEMARSLYREWFVHFRFPGHEKAKRVASPLGEIPEGWEVKKLGEIAEDMRRNVPKGRLLEPKPYVGLEHIPRRALALDAWETVVHLGSNKLEFKKDEILFGKIRPYFHKVSVAPFDGLCSADTIVIRARRPSLFAFVVACVSSDAFVAHASATSNGAKMPRANWDVLRKYEVAIPNGRLAERFSELFADTIAQQQSLVFQMQNLRRTRDLLLPRLLSGQETD